jgi:hypothetical protein
MLQQFERSAEDLGNAIHVEDAHKSRPLCFTSRGLG